jgi:hypothetical protein
LTSKKSDEFRHSTRLPDQLESGFRRSRWRLGRVNRFVATKPGPCAAIGPRRGRSAPPERTDARFTAREASGHPSTFLNSGGRYLDTQARPSPIGLHTPLQHSASSAQAEPSALQAMSRGSGVGMAARLCSVKNAITVRCEAVFSRSHAAPGKATMPVKIVTSIGRIADMRMTISRFDSIVAFHWTVFRVFHSDDSNLGQRLPTIADVCLFRSSTAEYPS